MELEDNSHRNQMTNFQQQGPTDWTTLVGMSFPYSLQSDLPRHLLTNSDWTPELS